MQFRATVPLPQGWESKFDPNTRRYYFINHITKRTQWEDPRTTMQFYPQPQQRMMVYPQNYPINQFHRSPQPNFHSRSPTQRPAATVRLVQPQSYIASSSQKVSPVLSRFSDKSGSIKNKAASEFSNRSDTSSPSTVLTKGSETKSDFVQANQIHNTNLQLLKKEYNISLDLARSILQPNCSLSTARNLLKEMGYKKVILNEKTSAKSSSCTPEVKVNEAQMKLLVTNYCANEHLVRSLLQNFVNDVDVVEKELVKRGYKKIEELSFLIRIFDSIHCPNLTVPVSLLKVVADSDLIQLLATEYQNAPAQKIEEILIANKNSVSSSRLALREMGYKKEESVTTKTQNVDKSSSYIENAKLIIKEAHPNLDDICINAALDVSNFDIEIALEILADSKNIPTKEPLRHKESNVEEASVKSTRSDSVSSHTSTTLSHHSLVSSHHSVVSNQNLKITNGVVPASRSSETVKIESVFVEIEENLQTSIKPIYKSPLRIPAIGPDPSNYCGPNSLLLLKKRTERLGPNKKNFNGRKVDNCHGHDSRNYKGAAGLAVGPFVKTRIR